VDAWFKGKSREGVGYTKKSDNTRQVGAVKKTGVLALEKSREVGKHRGHGERVEKKTADAIKEKKDRR